METSALGRIPPSVAGQETNTEQTCKVTKFSFPEQFHCHMVPPTQSLKEKCLGFFSLKHSFPFFFFFFPWDPSLKNAVKRILSSVRDCREWETGWQCKKGTGQTEKAKKKGPRRQTGNVSDGTKTTQKPIQSPSPPALFCSPAPGAEREVQAIITFLFLPISYSQVALLLQGINYELLLLS